MCRMQVVNRGQPRRHDNNFEMSYDADEKQTKSFINN